MTSLKRIHPVSVACIVLIVPLSMLAACQLPPPPQRPTPLVPPQPILLYTPAPTIGLDATATAFATRTVPTNTPVPSVILTATTTP